MAEYYSKNLAREVMKGMSESARKCQHTGGIPPLGFDVDPATKRYVVNEREAETVRQIFDMYISGFGYGKIIDELNSQGRRTKLGKPFGKNSLHDILANEKYAGVFVFNRAASKDADGRRNNHQAKEDESVIRKEGGVPAIVDPEVFAQARAKMESNKRQPGRYKAKETYLLSGLVVCGECQKREGRRYSMMGNAKNSGRAKTRHVTYRCGNREQKKACDNPEIRREYLEDFVLAELERNVLSEKAIPRLLKRLRDYQRERGEKSAAEVEALRAELAQVDKEIANIVEAVARGFSKSAMASKLDELDARKGDLTARMSALEGGQRQREVTEEELRGLFGMFRQYIRERNVPEIRKFLHCYIEKVVVFKDRVEVVLFFCPEKADAPLTLTVRASRGRLVRSRGKAA